jgi:hypothetical protein
VSRAFLRHLVFDAMIVIGGTVLTVIVLDYRHRTAQAELALDATRSDRDALVR